MRASRDNRCPGDVGPSVVRRTGPRSPSRPTADGNFRDLPDGRGTEVQTRPRLTNKQCRGLRYPAWSAGRDPRSLFTSDSADGTGEIYLMGRGRRQPGRASRTTDASDWDPRMGPPDGNPDRLRLRPRRQNDENLPDGRGTGVNQGAPHETTMPRIGTPAWSPGRNPDRLRLRTATANEEIYAIRIKIGPGPRPRYDGTASSPVCGRPPGGQSVTREAGLVAVWARYCRMSGL